jgi:hypothetical protein
MFPARLAAGTSTIRSWRQPKKRSAPGAQSRRAGTASSFSRYSRTGTGPLRTGKTASGKKPLRTPNRTSLRRRNCLNRIGKKHLSNGTTRQAIVLPQREQSATAMNIEIN